MLNNMIMNEILYKYIFAAVFIVIRAFLLSIAVRNYNESRGVKEKNSLFGFIFVFGLIAVIIYLIKSKKDSNNCEVDNNSSGNKIKFIFIIVFYIILFIAYEIILANFDQILSILNII